MGQRLVVVVGDAQLRGQVDVAEGGANDSGRGAHGVGAFHAEGGLDEGDELAPPGGTGGEFRQYDGVLGLGHQHRAAVLGRQAVGPVSRHEEQAAGDGDRCHRCHRCPGCPGCHTKVTSAVACRSSRPVATRSAAPSWVGVPQTTSGSPPNTGRRSRYSSDRTRRSGA